MKRMRFTAQELYVLAATAGKGKMYGIPDGFAWVPDEELQAARQQVSDALLEEDVLAMDFDGKLSVAADYQELVDVYCDCKKCLTVNRQSTDGKSEDLIFWQKDGNIYRAEIDEDWYAISNVSPFEAEASVVAENWPERTSQPSADVIIPQIALTKAKRYAMNGNTEEAHRILRQNGADDRTAAVLCDGLQERAQYVGLLLMDMRSGDCKKTESAFLSSRGINFVMGTTVVNFRTCTTFTECEGAEAQRQIKELVSAFLRTE